MGLTERSIQAPVAVAVGVIFIILFGMLAFFRIPIQLTPDIDQPSITVETVWPGASPQEVEREIVDRQEEQLKSVEGLVKMTSESQDSRGTIILEFPVGVDIDATALKVANKLDQVEQMPTLAEKPVISNVDSRSGAITWMTLQLLPGNDRHINTYRNFCKDFIQPTFERIEGVARCNIFGGTERELYVTVDPRKLSAHGIRVDEVAQALRRENRNISGGDFDEGKRRYIVRTLGEFTTPEDIENIVIRQQGRQTIYLKDLGEASLGYDDADFTVRRMGTPSIAMNCQRAAGANVLVVMEDIRATMQRLNAEELKTQGIELTQVYDETIYIYSALDLVRQNIFIGGILAILVLFIFLRSLSSVFIIATAIPVSIVGTFLAMSLLGRNLNVISLAGMSFAIGMVVDNAIVVLENIFRHRQLGASRTEAARAGTVEVWGAILASTLTTMAVFIPILFMKEEIGQLYRDIALAISSAVALSMIVSLSVIPALAARIMGGKRTATQQKSSEGRRVAIWISSLVYRLCGRTSSRLAVTVALTGLAIGLSLALVPPAEYLPQGNRNLVFGILLPPPGYNLDELTRMGKLIETETKAHFPEYEGLANTNQLDPKVEHFFFVARGRNVFMGAAAHDPAEVRELVPLLRKPLRDVPGLIAIITQSSLFGRNIGQGRNIDLEITGPDMDRLLGLSGRIFGQLMGILPTSQMRPIPSLDLGNPEIAITPDRVLAAKVGLSTEQIGVAVDVFLDGRKVDDYKFEGEEIDLVLRGPERKTYRSQDLAELPLATPSGEMVTLGSIARIENTAGPEQINHLERRRAITISIVPPEDLPLETAMTLIREQVIAPLKQQGEINDLYQVKMAGTADDLAVTGRALKWNFVLALVISYLLMCALFESFLYPFVILFSVPLAAVGGFLGLRLTNLFIPQPMDTLTMLGFIILIGTVVNNAILIVHQALNHIRNDGLAPREAIRESVRTRVRPIFMSMTTTVLGMLPLVLFLGAGSELYRGIGSVVIGGLVISTLFTLILVPSLFSLVLSARERITGSIIKPEAG